MEKKPLTNHPETRGGINEKTISIRVSGFNIWLTFISNQQLRVRNVIKRLPNKCRLIIVNIFGSVLIVKINLNLKKDIAAFIVPTVVLSALRFRRGCVVK